MKKSPLKIVAERFDNKEGLVAAVRELATDDLWLDRVNEDMGLEHVSNRKLLHLHGVLSAVKDQFGGRSGLIDEILRLEKREKDEGFRARLEGWPTPRLWDAYGASAKNGAAA